MKVPTMIGRRARALLCPWLFVLTIAACHATSTGTGAGGSTDTSRADSEGRGKGPSSGGADLREVPRASENSDTPAIEILEEEGRYVYDGDGLLQFSFRRKFKILTRAGVDEWSMLGADWRSWFEERPELRATVIAPDGRTYELDPATIAVGSDSRGEGMMLTDVQTLRAPIPGLSVGAVVDEEVSMKQHRLFGGVPTVNNFYFANSAPTRSSRVTIDVPNGKSLVYKTFLTGVEPKIERIDGGKRFVFEQGPMEPLETVVPFLPPGEARAPVIVFSLENTWKAVVASYTALTGPQIVPEQARELLEIESVVEARTREEKISAALAAIQATVRYTGVEFGEAAIVPRTPAETLARKFGDCKDKAALLVAALRALGIDAHIALLRAGFTMDVVDEVPGLSKFNHAIVFVPAETPIWIDPTADHARAGQLPVSDQGRKALIIAPGTSALSLIPRARSTANQYVETREFTMAPSGGSRVLEVTEYTGVMELNVRDMVATSPPERLRETLEGYVEDEYAGGTLEVLERTDPRDLNASFRYRLEISDAFSGYTDGEEAAVVLNPTSVLQWLPDLVIDWAEAGEGGDEEPRTRDLWLNAPFFAEVRYVVHPAPAYSAERFPEIDPIEMGPASFHAEFSEEDGVVTARFVLDSGDGKFAPDELKALVKGVRRIQALRPLFLNFDHVGVLHLRAGRVRESLETYQMLIKDDPDRSLYHAQYAQTLLAAGFGETARAVARHAIDLEPDRAGNHVTMGWVLEHDLLGRRFEGDWDREGAAKAYRRAMALDPEDAVARGSLAILLEHNERGTRYADDVSLDESIRQYRELRESYNVHGFDQNLMLALFHAGRFDEVLELSQELDVTVAREGTRLAAVAILRGGQEAVMELARANYSKEVSQEVLQTTILLLMKNRQYAESVSLLEAAGDSGGDARGAQAAQMFKKMKRVEDVPLDKDDPGDFVRWVMSEVLLGDEEGDAPCRYFSAEVCHDEAQREAFAGQRRSTLRQFEEMGLPIDFFRDVVVCLSQTRVEGDVDVGYKVKLHMRGPSFDSRLQFYLTTEQGRLKLRGMARVFTELAQEAVKRLDGGSPEQARQWLNWAREDMKASEKKGPFETVPFVVLWPRDYAGDELEIRTAAAVLMITTETESALETLDEALGVEKDGARRLQINRARYVGYVLLERQDEAVEVAEALLEQYPNEENAALMKADALVSKGEWEAARVFLGERLEGAPGSVGIALQLASVETSRGRVKAAQGLLVAFEEEQEASAPMYNNMAWNSLFMGEVGQQALDWALQSNTMQKYKSDAALHTLATLYAETGQIKQARQFLLQSIAARDSLDPTPNDWYVVGRMAEHCHLLAAARHAYESIPQPEHAHPTDTYHLAQRRLSELEGIR